MRPLGLNMKITGYGLRILKLWEVDNWIAEQLGPLMEELRPLPGGVDGRVQVYRIVSYRRRGQRCLDYFIETRVHGWRSVSPARNRYVT